MAARKGRYEKVLVGHDQGRVERVTRADGRVAWELTDAARIGAEEASAVGGYERARLALEGG